MVFGGAALGALALANRLAAPRASPPLVRHRFLQVDGVRLHFIEQGEGSPVVLLHGNGAMAEDFVASGILARLARRYRVIAFDRPGFGHSERPRRRVWTFAAQADVLREGLRLLGIERAVLVGHSAGALATLQMGLRDPLGTAAMVLLSGFYFPRLRADMLMTSLTALPVLRPLTAFAASHLFGWLAMPAYLRTVFAPNPVQDSFLHDFPLAAVLRRGHLQATIADTPLLAWSAAMLPRRLDRLTMPVIILTGTDDRIVAGRLQSQRLHERIPGSVFRELPGVGHMIHHAAPDTVIAAIEHAAGTAEV